jgi:hypothetical protein
MTTLKKERIATAGKLVDEILNDILSAPDKEILEDDDELTEITGESGGDFVKRAMAAALTALGKRRFAEIEAEMRESEKQPQIIVVPSDPAGVKRAYVESLRNAASRLSLAARGAKEVSEEDLNSAMEDLTELRSSKKGPKKK